MKLKQVLEDFKVEEISQFEISKEKDAYQLYLLEKKNLETFYLLNYLAKKNNLPFSEFGLAGLKDKHAFTKQYLTLSSKYPLRSLEEKNFRLVFLGYVPQKIKIGDLNGNRFEITVRALKKSELENIRQRADDLKSNGTPNYFDSQRFGSVINRNFIAKSLIKKNYQEAVKLYLTQYTKSEKKQVKQEKRAINQNWPNFSALNIQTKPLKKIIEAYQKTKDWLVAYQKIPSFVRELFLSAYQSHLWNECLKEVLKSKLPPKKLFYIKYNIGNLIFYKNLEKEELAALPSSFPTLGPALKPAPSEQQIIDRVLKKENLSLADLKLEKKIGHFFGIYQRPFTLFPEQLEITFPEPDELNKNCFKVTLSFILPKGSYATIVVKRIFGR